MNAYLSGESSCNQMAYPKDCREMNDQIFLEEEKRWEYTSYFRHFAGKILATLVAVPTIFYGALRGLAVAALWVYHGYKPTGS